MTLQKTASQWPHEAAIWQLSRCVPTTSDVVTALARDGYFYGGCELASDNELLAFVSSFGVPVRELRDGTVVKEISPTSSERAAGNTLSSRHGLGAFPFHTDAAYWKEPARWLVLWCVSPGAGSRATFLSDAQGWALSEHERHVLRNEIWVVRHVRDPFLCTHMDRDGSIRAVTGRPWVHPEPRNSRSARAHAAHGGVVGEAG
jgi:hypothetical protein